MAQIGRYPLPSLDIWQAGAFALPVHQSGPPNLTNHREIVVRVGANRKGPHCALGVGWR